MIIRRTNTKRWIIDGCAYCVTTRKRAIELHQERMVKTWPQLLAALKAVYQDIELQNVPGGSCELNLMVQEALALAEKGA